MCFKEPIEHGKSLILLYPLPSWGLFTEETLLVAFSQLLESEVFYMSLFLSLSAPFLAASVLMLVVDGRDQLNGTYYVRSHGALYLTGDETQYRPPG